MRIVELPLPLCPVGRLAIAVLLHRDSPMAVGWTAWLGDDLDFDGETPPETYNLLASHDRFAQYGVATEEYPAETYALDFERGLVVQLYGADVEFEPPTSANGLQDEILVFVGNEVMSVIGATLLGPGLYRLKLSRGRFGTEPQTHDAGSDVYIIAKDDLLAITHPSFEPGKTLALKIPTTFQRFKEDLEAVAATEYEIVGKAFDVSPSNLRVNGAQRNARFSPGVDVRIDWSLPELRWSIADNFGHKVRTLVEIVSPADEVRYRKLTTAQYFKIGGAKMATVLGGDTEFIVRLSTDVLSDSRINSTPITLNVKQA